jgi:hypothetical protein
MALPESGKVKLQLSNGSHILADHVLVAVGLQPNTELAEKVHEADLNWKTVRELSGLILRGLISTHPRHFHF